MTRAYLLAVAAALTIGCSWVSSAGAEAPSQIVVSVSAEVPIAAGGGWLLWSVPASGGWALRAYHAGQLETLPIRPRPEPFDVSLGTDLHGAAVATFSRCTHTPNMRNAGEEQSVPGGSLLEPRSGSGCRIHVLELASGRERTLPIPHPSDTSDTTPSMWGGSVAFARRAPGHGQVWQVMLWSPRHPRILRTLRHGAIPMHCAEGCGRSPAHGEVEALDRNAGIVTFLWAVAAPGVVGEGAWEVRVDDLASGRSRLAGAGFGHEACTAAGIRPGEIELAWPEAPIADGRLVLFGELESFDCFSAFGSSLNGYRVGTLRPRSGPLSETVLGLAQDGRTLYALVPPTPPRDVDSPSCSDAAPCELERVTEPALKPDRYTPARPFTESA
jgi:hypothetical protein